MKIKPKTAVAINMFAYGVTTIVSTTQERIDWNFNEFNNQPDKKFGKGAGKRQLCAFLYQQIKREDAFFSSDIFNAENIQTVGKIFWTTALPLLVSTAILIKQQCPLLMIHSLCQC